MNLLTVKKKKLDKCNSNYVIKIEENRNIKLKTFIITSSLFLSGTCIFGVAVATLHHIGGMH
ncbi:hypothetical protein [Bacillus sp. AFS055030]|uniref:hypothetical protein n=1 Tax=Bacillus sp. AFS055030 TaxID=2033507 RepID=UPI000BFD33DE|nr:hypothetical protein [Bacillus sp. AFS055030]PGL73441.1 hypothetical protein CN925_00120 [Bacillus sp. AFS055030]